MGAEKTPAIILKVVDFSETSCVITMLTKSAGRISGMAKGARRPKGPFFGAIDILSVSNVVFIPKKTGNLDLLTEAKLDRRFRPCRWSLARLYAGYHVAELLLELTEPHYPMPLVYELAIETLDLLQENPQLQKSLDGVADSGEISSETEQSHSSPSNLPVSSIILWFELKLLSLLGHAPLLDACTGCGRLWNNHGIEKFQVSASRQVDSESENNKEIGPADRTDAIRPTYPSAVYFSFQEGGLVCSRCRHGKRNLYSIPRQYIPVLQQFSGWDREELESALTESRESLTAAGHRSLRGLMKHYWRNHLGHRLKLEGPMAQIAAKEWAAVEKSEKTALD